MSDFQTSSTSKAARTIDTVSDETAPTPLPRVVNRQADLITVEPLKQGTMLQPSYAHVQPIEAGENGTYGAMIDCFGSVAGTLGAIPGCFCCPQPYKPVHQGYVGLIQKFGRFYKAVDPGLVKINPFSEKIRIVDVRIQVIAVGAQTVFSSDNVSLQIDSVIYYHIVNPYKATFGIADVRQALIERAQTTLRDVIAGRNLQSLLTDREAVAAEIETIVDAVAARWGVNIESILIKDIIFSADLQASLSSAAQQKRIGESKVIQARAEVESAVLMRKAADILASPAAMQIRALESYVQMAKSSNAKTIFVPMQLLDQSGGGGPQATASGSGGAGNLFAQANVLEQMGDK